MVILVIHKIVAFIMYVSMDVIIVQFVHQVLVGNHYYVYVCLLILLVVKIRNHLNHHQVNNLLFFNQLIWIFIGSSKQKWLQLFTRSVIKTTTTSPLPFALPSIFTCAGRVNGYYADPVHCHKFHYCGTGI